MGLVGRKFANARRYHEGGVSVTSVVREVETIYKKAGLLIFAKTCTSAGKSEYEVD